MNPVVFTYILIIIALSGFASAFLAYITFQAVAWLWEMFIDHAWNPMLERIPVPAWLVSPKTVFFNIIAEINEHLRDVNTARHRKIDFTEWVQDVREISEGRRMPVSIHG